MTDGPPLGGVVVVSLAGHYPGPFATMLLSDWGADVINVERPGGDPARSFPAFHAGLARGKRSVVLDLKDRVALDAFYELVRLADVVVEGYRPGVAQRLAVDYESLRAIRPDLVYVSISAFGQDGPSRDLPAHDINLQARAGLLAPDIGAAGRACREPPRLAMADLAAGQAAAQAVLLGLLRRSRDEAGSYIDVSMLDATLSLLATEAVGVVDPHAGRGLEHEAGYGIFACSDGRELSIGIANEDRFWKALVDVTELNPSLRSLSGDERIERRQELQEKLAAAFLRATCDEWVERLEASRVPASAVQGRHDALVDAQVIARAMVVADPDGGLSRFIRQPLTIDGYQWGPRGAVPKLGADTHRVLTAAGVAVSSVNELGQHSPGSQHAV